MEEPKAAAGTALAAAPTVTRVSTIVEILKIWSTIFWNKDVKLYFIT